MKNRIYKARPGHIKITDDHQATQIGRFLEQNFPDGIFKPRDIVNIARDPRSPIHEYFEWDDSKAAELYRVQQARILIRTIIVEIDGNNVPAFHHVNIEDSSSYVDVNKCLEVQDLWDQVLDKALGEARSWAERYKSYKQLEPIRASIENVIKEFSNERLS